MNVHPFQHTPLSDGEIHEECPFRFKFSGITPTLQRMCRVKCQIVCSGVLVVNTKFKSIDHELTFFSSYPLSELKNTPTKLLTLNINLIADYLDTRILKGISSMLHDSTFADFVFNVQGREFKVHKLILATASPVMAKMFTTDMEEAKSNKCTIEHIKSDTFSHLLELVYVGNFRENISATDAMMLYEAAHYYEIMNLQQPCHQIIHKMLTIENAVELYKWAQPYDLEELKADAWLIIKR